MRKANLPGSHNHPLRAYEPRPRMPDEHPTPQSSCVRRAALVCIDLQYLGASEGHGLFENHKESGVSEQAIQYYLDRVENTVVPNTARLQKKSRQLSLEVIHSRIQSLTRDGRDRSPEHKRLGVHAPPGSELAEFLPGVAPEGDEIIINKTASGLFTSTNLHYVLHNLAITDLYITGVYTNECVSSAVRGAADLGYEVTLVSDATAAITPELHRATILTTKGRYANVKTTTEVLKELETFGESAEATG
ncbi:cysteine hydrolase family protein [Bowmanella dokdonensis]|uniref:Cysteine hydrolase n=1 Tax=Bowmanella dokdonensis TaxID=751969 RepID=A0A939DPE3_9ALTE|nr:isochorismatase family cysteine hydrolase [Bowmanella dokdonensis]MBN7825516.1 cysteine hydrolase [Bowmanella dokdonensis]